MASPKSVNACLGLVPSILDGVRRIPGKAVQLPVIAVSSALAGIDFAKREYGDLSGRGERLVARLRGVEEVVEDTVTGVTRDVTQAVSGDASPAVAKAADAAKEAAQQVKESAEASHAFDAVQGTLLPEAERPKGEPTPKAEKPAGARVDSAATAEVVKAVEQAAAATSVPSADELPLPDYDHMTLGSLRGRLRSLTVEQLVMVRAYEKSKADRLPIVTMLDNRIAKLAAGGAQPTGAAPATEPAAAKPPKSLGEPAAADVDTNPPHTKVRTT